jgi:hypothetical protein
MGDTCVLRLDDVTFAVDTTTEYAIWAGSWHCCSDTHRVSYDNGCLRLYDAKGTELIEPFPFVREGAYIGLHNWTLTWMSIQGNVVRVDLRARTVTTLLKLGPGFGAMRKLRLLYHDHNWNLLMDTDPDLILKRSTRDVVVYERGAVRWRLACDGTCATLVGRNVYYRVGERWFNETL